MEENNSIYCDYQYSRWLASPPADEEVVISGISGRFPESHNVEEFRDNLLNKIEMVNDDGRRWKLDHPEIPQRTAKIFDIDKYDAGYFGVHHRQADSMEPMTRIAMETTIEAIMDAGVSPSDLEGSRTGVFFSTIRSNEETTHSDKVSGKQTSPKIGCFHSLISHRISYYLKLKGPSCNVDTACSSSLNAMEVAFRFIRSGQCDNAIVGGANLLMHPVISLQFFRLGILSPKGVSRVFDQEADGFVRGEAISCVFLQRAQSAKRIYARIVNLKINGDGYKEQGITFPSSQAQSLLMSQIYEESQIHPSQISFMEAHATGTIVGDPQEVEAIDSALAKFRDQPLLVGSVKCNIGHSEPASGISSLIKAIIAMDTGLIAPNINFTKIKNGMEGIEQGRIKVVTEVTKLDKDDAVIGINNFGFGGSNAHLILRRFQKKKINGGLPEDDIPRLVCVSGRTKSSVMKMLNFINTNSLDGEYVGLLHHMYKANIQSHMYRGYTIVSKTRPLKTSSKLLNSTKPPLYIVYGNFQQSFKMMGTYLLKFSLFRQVISRINKLLTNQNVKYAEDPLTSGIGEYDGTLGAICVQIGLIEVLNSLELHPTAVYGEDFGKIAAAYYHKAASLEEAISSAIDLHHLKTEKYPKFDTEFIKFERTKKYDSSSNIPNNTLVLNISDAHMSDSDMLPVENGTVMFLEILGRLYEEGYNSQLQNLYPKIVFPVSRSTPMVSHLIEWNHNKSWYVYKFTEFSKSDNKQMEYHISCLDEDYKFIRGHVVDGRNLIPATEYLRLAWKTFAQHKQLQLTDLPVIFEDCKFRRAVTVTENNFVNLSVTFYKAGGYFEVLEKDFVVVSGRIRTCTDISQEETNFEPFVFNAKDTENTFVLEQDEIYRELHLRGYNYGGMFKGIKKSNLQGSAGLLQWQNNWSSFMDTMLQMMLIQTDTRLLLVPVCIQRIMIDPMKHKKIVDALNPDELLVPVSVYKDCDVIKSGGIEICGLQAKSIARRRTQLEPIVEKHVFVPNTDFLSLLLAIRVNTQIVLENSLVTYFKAFEIVDDYTNADEEFLLPLVCKAVNDMPMVTTDLTISSTKSIEDIPGVKIENVTLTSESNMLLIIGSKLFQRMNTLKEILTSLHKNGFVLTREELDFVSEPYDHIDIVTEYVTTNEKLILFKKHEPIDCTFVEVYSSNPSWLTETKNAMKQSSKVVVYSKNEEPEGVLGLVNCIRREPNGIKLNSFFMFSEAQSCDPQNEFYRTQIRKNLAINIYKNNTWGTYRHLPLEEPSEALFTHCYVDTTTKGNISSLKWLEGEINDQTPTPEGRVLVNIYYSAINFKDIMVASGRVGIEALVASRIEQETLLGFEFSGRDPRGRRVAGMVGAKSLASHVFAHEDLLLEVPDVWSLEDAATVPVVYITVMYALLMRANLKPKSSILIHSGTGGIGLAALNVCLHYKCDIYVTVGTQEKREYLREHYPQIPESHIGNSRDTSFEEMIHSETQSRGVDIVLNSLSEDKLRASVRCLARGGIFLEIGKFDMAIDTALQLLLMKNEISYHGIMLDHIFSYSDSVKSEILQTVKNGIKDGYIKPLPRTVFTKDEIEASYRHMMTGKHMGKVLVKIRDEEEDRCCVPQKVHFRGLPRFHCDVRCSYIIVGGLGGVGLELADWLVLRGAKTLVFVSRSGVQSGYQKQRIILWRSYGVQVQVSLHDVTTRQGCVDLIKEANSLGSVDGVFNLAVVLKDALFEDQTEETFLSALMPKANVTNFLDQVTRELCSQLRYFVVFSSITCGRGNAGQSNYGMANSIMERICEKRKEDGLPALAIQWGAIGEVGVVAKMQKENQELVIGGTLQQKISSCFEVLDKFLKQDDTVVSSMVAAEKSRKGKLSSPAEAVAHILGIKDIKTVSHHLPLPELGMDSLMGTEIMQLLESDFEIYLTVQDMRSLTFAKLKELEAKKESGTKLKDDKTEVSTKFMIQFIPKESDDELPIKRLESQVKEDEEATTAFMFPGSEGAVHVLEPLAKLLKAHIMAIQYSYSKPPETAKELAETIIPHIETNLPRNGTFSLIGYSFGSIVALEVGRILESIGYNFTICLIDGSPTYLSSSSKDAIPGDTDAEVETSLIFNTLNVLWPVDDLAQHKGKFLKCAKLEDRIDLIMTIVPSKVASNLKKQALVTLCKRFKAMRNYEMFDEKLTSEIYLFKAKYPMCSEEEDYQLSQLCEKPLHVSTIDGDHVTILNQPDLAASINEIIASN